VRAPRGHQRQPRCTGVRSRFCRSSTAAYDGDRRTGSRHANCTDCVPSTNSNLPHQRQARAAVCQVRYVGAGNATLHSVQHGRQEGTILQQGLPTRALEGRRAQQSMRDVAVCPMRQTASDFGNNQTEGCMQRLQAGQVLQRRVCERTLAARRACGCVR
jgi:hypothetical protein